jgi:hypothetical protein
MIQMFTRILSNSTQTVFYQLQKVMLVSQSPWDILGLVEGKKFSSVFNGG